VKLAFRDGMARTMWLARVWILRRPAVQRWRERRYEMFEKLVALKADDSILDVGCGPGGGLEVFNQSNPITGLDPRPSNREAFERFPRATFVEGDARDMPFADLSFAVVFSNSVIEHVPRGRDRELAASEIRRVGLRYFVQTPNRWFPIEPHYMLPLFQFLPRRLRHYYDRRFHDDQIDLLSARELQDLFPDAEIHRERFFGLTKSLLAVRA
jgi:SAM-dependent methyltransferase